MKRLFALALLASMTVSCAQDETAERSDNGIIIANTLSNQRVRSFAEDSDGHMWIGTFRGLNKYAGNEYIQYFQTDDGAGLPDNEVYKLFKDRTGRLWVTTTGGVCYFTDQESFSRPKNSGFNLARQIVESPDGRVFFNDRMQVLEYLPQFDSIRVDIVYDPVQQTGSKLFFAEDNSMILVTSSEARYYDSCSFELKRKVKFRKPSSCWAQMQDGTIWCSGTQGIFIFDPYTGHVSDVPEPLRREPSLSALPARVILQYDMNTIVIAPNNGEMLVYHIPDNQIIRSSSPEFPLTIPSGKVYDMYKDRLGNLWLSHGNQGYSLIRNEKRGFNADNVISSRLRGQEIISTSVDSKGRLWLASGDGHLYYCVDRNLVELDLGKALLSEAARMRGIYQMFIDKDDDIWISAAGLGVRRFSFRDDALRLSGKWDYTSIISYEDDGLGHVWIGGFSPVIHRIDKTTGEVEGLRLYPEAYSHISAIKMTGDGLLAGTFPNDIRKIDPVAMTARAYIPEEIFRKELWRGEYIPTCFYEDSDGIIWIGTNTNGLFIWNPVTRVLTRIEDAPCNDIAAICEDFQGNIWVSTQYGLGEYNKSDRSFTNYNAEDGIGGNQFLDRSAALMGDGTLVFGGTHGVTVVNPVGSARKHAVPLAFEYLKIHNKLVYPGEGSPIRKSLSCCPEVTINHKQNGFSIAYAALDYSNDGHGRYYYKMDGFDRYWVDVGSNNVASYANLPAGHYTFRVRIGDNSTVNNEIALPVHVKNAPWFSWWAILGYLLLVAIASWQIINMQSRIRIEKAAAKKAERGMEQEQRTNKMNMSFFANVAHEFRTPLTLISGPVTLLSASSSVSSEDRRLLGTIQQNVSRMLVLVNQMLDLGKLENDTLPLKVCKKDMVPVARELAGLFQSRAKTKHITLNFYSHEPSLPVLFDEDKLSKILTNLLSNAFKFTPENGSIVVSLDVLSGEQAADRFKLGEDEKSRNYVHITVSDTGCGISGEQTEKIFEKYYQASGKDGGVYNYGTGIGLYYCRALATIHHGYIKASNRVVGTGAEFSLILPIDEDAYLPGEVENGIVAVTKPVVSMFAEQCEEEVGASDGFGKKLLVVDDEISVTKYLKDLLSSEYDVTCCFDADTALEKLKAQPFDLVMSDVAMPLKDGYELCKEIKTDPDICHIPVILVTANVAIEKQIRGLDMGADAYVTKPFDPFYLKSLIRSQLDNRERIRALVQSSTSTKEMEGSAIQSQDKEFLDRLYALMESELSNTELNSEKMASALYVSRSKLFYKVKSLTGQAPIDFFKQYKLNRASEMLKSGGFSIAQIADLTGFSSPSKFSALFKKHFGVAPSAFKKGAN